MSGPTTTPTPATAPPLRALVVDDEAPTLAELAWLLEQDDRVGEVRTASSGTDALRVLEDSTVDVVFSDVSMPGLDGLDLARVLARFSQRPQVVFVTAYDDHAVDAFELAATDYVMKPIRAERLREAVRRVVEKRDAGEERPGERDDAAARGPQDETIPVELGGVTTFVQRSRIRYATAHGDYARLHTDAGSHLVRVSLNALEERWGEAGFARIHRSTLVSLPHVTSVSMDGGRCRVSVGDVVLQVSRRHTRALRERLLRSPR
ncbi:LytR/AlgR family response regulator transcription factor [Lapillicoccus jejuensis]|nr:LytTR family DNA-binding domain-containing protein [Lapillicoccus jejuensis]